MWQTMGGLTDHTTNKGTHYGHISNSTSMRARTHTNAQYGEGRRAVVLTAGGGLIRAVSTVCTPITVPLGWDTAAIGAVELILGTRGSGWKRKRDI